jgi:hypothetical protein
LEDEDFAAKLIFSDEATFHLSGEVNRHNVRLWGTANPRAPRSLVELRERIAAAVMTIDRMMLQNVWNELDYRLDVCRVTQGAHIEHL